MVSSMHSGSAHDNPLQSDDPGAWERLVAAVGPASLLVVIASRMGPLLSARYTPEDVLQEALLHAWRDRGRFEWRGIKHFRSWLLTVIDHRIGDLADHEGAQKRGGGARAETLSRAGARDSFPVALQRSTTPSRTAIYREQAALMARALAMLPEDVREVVRMRLFERTPIEEIAARLAIGESAVRHRFRRGAAAYQSTVASMTADSVILRATVGNCNPSL